MAKIPGYESTKTLNLSAPAPRATGVGLARDMQAQAGAIEAVSQAEDAMVKVRDFRETNEAGAHGFEQLQAIKAEADQDIGFDTSKYETKIQKIAADAAKTITGQNARDAFMADFNRQSSATLWGIKNDFRQKEINTAKATTALRHEQIVSSYGDMNPAQQIESIGNYKLMLQDAVNKGVYAKPEADLQWDKFQKDIHESGVNTDIANDPATTTEGSGVLNELNKGDGGKYNLLNSIQREDAIKKARLKINENKQYSVEVKVDNRLDILKQFADGKIDALNSGPLIKSITLDDPELGEAIKAGTNNLSMLKIKIDADNKAFVATVKDIFDKSTTKEDIGKFLMNTLNSSDNKRISRDRLAILINAGVERAKEMAPSADHPPVTISPQRNEMDSTVKAILTNSNPLFSTANMLINFFKGVSGGNTTPQQAQADAIKSEIHRTNPASVKYKIGDIITNPKTGQSAEVTGINDNGSPIVRKRISGK